ncbi:DNA repair protein RadC [Candidatus Gracilibacteria bacterium 28_42_T64]|nr:DNA repair protein RadC [Candidatus Gracilibacteria bacterium 28_42_T64]
MMMPREKLLQYGPAKLEGYELVATILGSGIKGIDVFKLSKIVNRVIEKKQENIELEDLMNIKGIGSVKAMQIISAFELAKRYFIKDSIIVGSINDVLGLVRDYRNKKQEYLLSITLDGANRLISQKVITIGLLNQSLVHPREVFSPAIEDRANSIVLIHNHPSGSTYPSENDKIVTQRLKEVSELVGIKLLDHVIVTKGDYFSFSENGIL